MRILAGITAIILMALLAVGLMVSSPRPWYKTACALLLGVLASIPAIFVVFCWLIWRLRQGVNT